MIALQGGLPEVGDLVAAKYRLLGVLGRGGMGIVFDADHELLDRRVALKVLAPEVSTNLEAVQRFMNEARAAARITSDHVVNVLDVGVLESGLPYMVMERLTGIDLGQLATRQAPIGIAEVVDLLVEAVEGVSHAHLVGIIHRDLKPSNLFLAEKPDRTRVVKVLDFGISKLTGPGRSPSGSVTATSTILGSPLYMSPEQLRSSKSIDLRADIWSLGVIGYELLTRTMPFEGDNLVELFVAIQERDARPLTELRADIPAGLDEAVRRCLRRSPEQRFASAYALGQALVPFGTSKARAAMDRLDVHLRGKQRTVDELRPTVAAVPAGPVTPPPTAAGRASQPSQPAAPAPASSLAPLGRSTGSSTAAPWSTTGRQPSKPRMIGVSALALAGTLAAGVVAVVLVRERLATDAAGRGLASGAADAMPLVTATVDARPLEVAAVVATDAAPPPVAVEIEPPASVPDASPKRHVKQQLPPAGVSPPSPQPPQPPPKASSSDPSPMNMKTY